MALFTEGGTARGGIGVEVFNFNTLEYVYRNVNSPFHREHVATNYYDYINQEPAKHTNFKVGTVICPVNFRRPDLILDVNSKKEYEFIKQLYEYLYPQNQEFGIMDVINWYDRIYKKS